MISRRALRVNRQSEVRPHQLRLRLSHQIFISDLSAHGQAGAGIMKVRPGTASSHIFFYDFFYSQDWVLVAAGIERFCFFVYTMAFALVTSVYI